MISNAINWIETTVLNNKSKTFLLYDYQYLYLLASTAQHFLIADKLYFIFSMVVLPTHSLLFAHLKRQLVCILFRITINSYNNTLCLFKSIIVPI